MSPRPNPLPEQAEACFHRLINALFRRWPRPAPPRCLLRGCRIVAHRGAHDNRHCLENSLAAFDAAVGAGVWGIELDVRGTRDQVPVVFHDADTRRLFGQNARIADMPLAALMRHFPRIPTLSAVIRRYGGRIHLMLEIKGHENDRPAVPARRLQPILAPLSPGRDFHLMSLHPEIFADFDFLPKKALLPIARLCTDRFSRLAIAREWGGVAGHYLAVTRGMLNHHHRLGQGIGTGFADSPRSLFREVSRGVDWIFSNRAVAMQALCDTAKRHAQGKNPNDI
ncbi:glycerophosphodiester phosphodiesterase [Desulfosarcina ovata]|uniref:glycerophosphodiester phosphodiesterase n=1 Tax=Desulfosarcina ovata TaxID=83564 RepID=UPI001390B1FE|nr:glycerophosphodiester phosphodiesterase [Desulfosarcina ovata]